MWKISIHNIVSALVLTVIFFPKLALLLKSPARAASPVSYSQLTISNCICQQPTANSPGSALAAFDGRVGRVMQDQLLPLRRLYLPTEGLTHAAGTLRVHRGCGLPAAAPDLM